MKKKKRIQPTASPYDDLWKLDEKDKKQTESTKEKKISAKARKGFIIIY